MSSEQLNCVCVIQARRGSSRLPDKILKPLAGKPVLKHVIERCLMIEGVDKVICAIPDDSFNNPVEALALEAGAEVSRGSEQDVLSRYWGAVEGLSCAYVMRVTADCPLLDPEICATLLKGVIKQGVRYGATAWWPHGLDCEVFEHNLLKETFDIAEHPNDREHVTLWMKRHTKGKNFIYHAEKNYMETERWVLDYPADLVFLEKLYSLLPEAHQEQGWKQVLETVSRHPELKQVNAEEIADWKAKTDAIYQSVLRNT